MIKKNTVLVLGAGASWAYYFPLGHELVEKILNFNPTYRVETGRGGALYDALLHSSLQKDKLGQFRMELKTSMLYSIDAFLSLHPEFDQIGRAAIACTLIPREVDHVFNSTDRPNWYKYFRNQLGERLEDFQSSWEKLFIITFNYDRSFEYFFWTSLRACYGQEEALALMKALKIVHVHGQLGKPDFLDKTGRSYSNELGRETVETAIQGIKVISDELDETPEFIQAREWIASAATICFLGFGYNDINLRRLRLNECLGTKVIMGTAFECEDDEIRRFSERIGVRPDGWRPIIRVGRSPYSGAIRPDNESIVFGIPDEDILKFLRKYPVAD